MTFTNTGERPLRLWPGLAAAGLLLVGRFIVPLVAPDAAMWGLLSGVVCALIVLLWWLFLSRAPWLERIGAAVLMVAATLAVRPLLHPSITNAGMGRMFYIMAVPVSLSLGLVLWAVTMRRLSTALRFTALGVTLFVACAFWVLLRTNGVTGEGISQLEWRWIPTAEQKLLAAAPPPPPPVTVVKETPPAPVPEPVAHPAKAPEAAQPKITHEWPGFRGPNRDSVVPMVRIRTDWAAAPPVELWRKPVGPGWSSFAVSNGLFYTQEQRGDYEVVACRNIATGEPVWIHQDKARFYESNGGPGPRGTPTLHNDRVYTFGATGILNALDAATGKVVWTRNAATDTAINLPGWGFTSSPIVIDDMVVVAVSGRLAAYDLTSGKPRWTGPSVQGSYGSPHLLTIAGVPQIVLITNSGATSVSPSNGKVLWRNEWDGAGILQPAVTADGGVLFATGSMMGGVGTRRLSVTPGPGGWTAKEDWTSNGLKPYFNDMVVHKGYAFGFDGGILSCIDLKDGKRKWKGGRFGHGQMLLLADQDLLLILSEQGELALVSATPDQFSEITRIKAIEGKTWNHPVLVRDTLLVRNGEEMAAFRLTPPGT